MRYQFDHVAQQVPDIAEAVAWYLETIPGARVLYQDKTWAFVDAGGARIAFVVRDEHPGHLAWRVPFQELEKLAEGYGKAIRTHRDGTKSFYLQGPGGEIVELISVEGTKWERLSELADTPGAAEPAY